MTHTTPDDAKEQPMNELKTLQDIKDYVLQNKNIQFDEFDLLFDLAFTMGEKHQLEEQLKNNKL